jgi:ketosteroid isomerase-like protein
MDWSDAQVSRSGEMESQTLDLGEMVGARHLIPAGFDSAPYYRGLPDGMCPCEHWCYLVRGKLRYRFVDGESIEVKAGDVFRVRGGHLADVLEDAELIELTQAEDYRRKAESVKQAAVERILKAAYAAFNDRDLDKAIALMHPNVDWPNAWEGGRMRGRSAVREYFERQFRALSSRVEPEDISKDSAGVYSVRVHQVVHEVMTGKLLTDSRLIHRWRLDGDNLVVRMDVAKGPSHSAS